MALDGALPFVVAGAAHLLLLHRFLDRIDFAFDTFDAAPDVIDVSSNNRRRTCGRSHRRADPDHEREGK
ncbi:MAG: hypothetical protein AAF411_29630 [Myxococcota bacterium]